MRDTPTRRNGKYDWTKSMDAPSGAQLAVYYKAPVRRNGASAKGVVHINHGLADHAGRYGRFANALSRAGFHVYAQDHRGHGATTAPDAPQGVFGDYDGWEMVLADIKFVNGVIKKAHPGLPMIMFGHSMGAMLSCSYLARWPKTIDACAIWNAAIVETPATIFLRLILKIEQAFKGAHHPSIASKLTFDTFNTAFKPNATSADWLTKDLGEAKAYEDDPDCGWRASVSMWRSLASGMRNAARLGALDGVPRTTPIYMLGGDADPSTRNAKGVIKFADQLEVDGFDSVKIQIRKDGRHEALNEPPAERDQVTQDFIAWLCEVCA